MSAVTIRFDALYDAADAAKKVSSDLSSYSDGMKQVVNSPLSQLVMGSSGYTSNAASAATAKANSLRNMAARYERFGRSISSATDYAKEVDERVAQHIKQLEKERAKDLSFWDKIGHVFHNVMNGILGPTEIGTILRNFNNLMQTGAEVVKKGIKDAQEWFVHGAGRYILNGLLSVVGSVLAVIGMVKAIGAFIGALALLATPAGWFVVAVAAIGAVAAIVSAAVSIGDTFATVYESGKALSLHNTEPGHARYYGNTSSMKDWSKKETTDANLQSAFATVDFIGDIAGFVSMVTGLFRAGSGLTDTYDLSADTFKKNLLKNVGVSVDDNGVKHFSMSHIFGLGKVSESTSKLDKVENILKPAKNIMSTEKWSIEVRSGEKFNGKVELKDFTGILGVLDNAFPDIKLFGNGKKTLKVINHLVSK